MGWINCRALYTGLVTAHALTFLINYNTDLGFGLTAMPGHGLRMDKADPGYAVSKRVGINPLGIQLEL